MENKGFLGNLFNKKDNPDIEKMISADQNTENLKNEIMGNTTNNLPTFDRPNIVNGAINDNQPKKEDKKSDSSLSEPLNIATPTDKPIEPAFPFGQPGDPNNTPHETLGLEVPGGSGVRIHHVDDLPPEEGEKEEEDALKKVNTLAGATQENIKVDVSQIKRRVRTRSNKKAFEIQSFNRLSVFLITFGLMVLISTGIYLFLANQATKSGSSLVLGDVIQVRNELNYYSLITLSAETNTTLPKKTTNSSSGITSNSGLNNNTNTTLNNNTTTTTTRSSDQFIRIKIEVTNKSSNVASIRGYNKFYIVDSNNKLISECLTAEDLKNYTVTDAFPSTIESGKTVSGYIYCKSTVNTLPILQIVSATNQNQVAKDGSITGGSTYFVHLAKSKK